MVEQVSTRGLRRHQHRGCVLQRRPEYCAQISTLLPRHFSGPDAKGEVMDEDRRGWCVRVAEGRARPVRIEDRVAVQLRLDRRKPAQLQRELVTVRREDSLAFEIR